MTEILTYHEPTEEIDLGMSNFDHSIDEGLEEVLKARPKEVFGRHAAYNFNSHVWWDGNQFVEQVWKYHQVVDYMAAPTLQELMETVNDKWGWE